MSMFDDAFTIILGEEGGYVNDPKDPGGETKFGICKRDYPNLDIKNLTPEIVKPIYKSKYWDMVKCDQLPWPLCLFIFDAAINQGCDANAKFATQKMLQKALKIPQTGLLDINTMDKAKKSSQMLSAIFMAQRAQRYMGTRNADIYLTGWLTRLFDVTMKGVKKA